MPCGSFFPSRAFPTKKRRGFWRHYVQCDSKSLNMRLENNNEIKYKEFPKSGVLAEIRGNVL
jgi:hypothetical protein